MKGEININILDYASACERASNRTNSVRILLLLVSILVFFTFWNSLPFAWHNLRLQGITDAVRLRVWDPKNRDSLESHDLISRFDYAREFAMSRSLTDSAQLQELRIELQKLQLEDLMNVKVPLLGVVMTFDINDLAFISGIAFTVLLTWLRYCLVREVNTLAFAHRKAEQVGETKEFLELLSIKQGLIIPHRKVIVSFWSRLYRSLQFLPFLVYTLIITYDIYTYRFAFTLSPLQTINHLLTGFVFFIVILFTTLFVVNTTQWLIRHGKGMTIEGTSANRRVYARYVKLCFQSSR
jgi:hypothetical protein